MQKIRTEITHTIQSLVNRWFGISSWFRTRFYSLFFPIGEGTFILHNFQVRNPKSISIGKGCFINYDCFIQGSGRVIIGDDVYIGPGVAIFSENHNYKKANKKIKEQGITLKKVIIEDDVWIGARATILAGVHLKYGCVVGAGAVVTKSFPKFSVIGGVPAKIIGKRK